MQLWRITARRWAERAFTGEGGLRVSGRWHPRGVPVVYTATSRALAALETLVHVRSDHRPPDLVLLEARVALELVEAPEPRELPEGWSSLADLAPSQAYGRRWIEEARSVGLQIPSAVLQGEWNVLLNPRHPAFDRVELSAPVPFVFDERLL